MTMPAGFQWLTWEVIFKIATVAILVFTGVKAERLTRIVHEVKEATEQVEKTTTAVKEKTTDVQRQVAETQDAVATNQALLETWPALSPDSLQLLERLGPLFQDIATRQHIILEHHTRTLAHLDARSQDCRGCSLG
jgi:type I site-specific restriction endonuclease